MQRTLSCRQHGQIAAMFMLGSLIALARGASGGTVLDQSYEPPLTDNTIIAARFEPAQTFTVGRTGMLDGVAVEIGRVSASGSDLLTLDVRRTLGGVPAEANFGPDILASLTLPASGIPSSSGFNNTFVRFDLQRFPVIAGQVLAIVLRTSAGATLGGPNDTPFVWTDSSAGAYAGGRAFVRGTDTGGTTWGDGKDVSAAGVDYGFRTFVAVPLPAALRAFPVGALLAAFAAIRISGKRSQM